MIRVVAAALIALALGCTTVSSSPHGEKMVTKTEQVKVANISYFDLANCAPQVPQLPERPSEGVLVGLLVAARPQIMECLVKPEHRGPKEETHVVVDTQVGPSGTPEHKVSGDNLTPDGEACVRAVLAKAVPEFKVKAAAPPPPPPPPAKGKGKKGKGKQEPAPAPVEAEAPPADLPPPGTVTAHAEFVHDATKLPAVQMGLNVVSDAAGLIRLSIPTWCDCFEPWKAAPSKLLKSKLKLTKPQLKEGEQELPPTSPPTSATVEPTQDAVADQVGACIQQKLAQLPFKTTVNELEIPYQYAFVNSNMADQLPDAPSWVQFAHLDAVRGQRSAEAAIAVGARSSAENIYNTLVAKYQKDQSVPVATLKDRCKALLKADEDWAKAIQNQLAVDERMLALVASLKKAEGDQWVDAETAAQQQVEETKKTLEVAQKTRASDAGACPVERYK